MDSTSSCGILVRRRRRLVAMFQPHRFSRTKALSRKFGSAFDDTDRVVITDVYAASETPISGITGRTIVDEIIQHGHRGVSYQPRLEWMHRDVGNLLESGDLVLSLGAGNIHEQLEILAADLVIAEKLKAIVGEDSAVRLYEPLSKHTTLRVGGPAQFWVEPQTVQGQIGPQRIGGGQADVFGDVCLGDERRLGDQGDRQKDEPDDDQSIDGHRLHGRIDEDAQDLWIG